jgi:hypothetical protein
MIQFFVDGVERVDQAARDGAVDLHQPVQRLQVLGQDSKRRGKRLGKARQDFFGGRIPQSGASIWKAAVKS